MTSGGVECSPLIFLMDADQLIGVTEIMFGEELCSLEKFKGSGHERQKVQILYSNIIEAPVINIRSERFFLLSKRETGTSRGRRGLNNARRQGVIDARLRGFTLGA